MHARFAELAVAQPADRVVLVEPLLRFGGGLDVPLDHLQPQRGGHLARELGLAGAGLSLHQEGPLQRYSRVNRNCEIIRRDIGVRTGEFHGIIMPLRRNCSHLLTEANTNPQASAFGRDKPLGLV